MNCLEMIPLSRANQVKEDTSHEAAEEAVCVKMKIYVL